MAVGRGQDTAGGDRFQKYFGWTQRDLAEEIWSEVSFGDDFHQHDTRPKRVKKEVISRLFDAFDIDCGETRLLKMRECLREYHPGLDDDRGGKRFDLREMKEILASLESGDSFAE